MSDNHANNIKEPKMKWVSVNEYLPPVGVAVLCFRPDALDDWSDKPLRICYRKQDGKFSGCHKVTHWLDANMPPGWTNDHGKRQHA